MNSSFESFMDREERHLNGAVRYAPVQAAWGQDPH